MEIEVKSRLKANAKKGDTYGSTESWKLVFTECLKPDFVDVRFHPSYCPTTDGLRIAVVQQVALGYKQLRIMWSKVRKEDSNHRCNCSTEPLPSHTRTLVYELRLID